MTWPNESPLCRNLRAELLVLLDEVGLLSLMNRVFRALLVVLCFEMGALLLYLPWTAFWEQNYFLSHFPSLMPVLLHPSFRGAISGLGVVDIILAIGMIGSRSGPTGVPPR